MVGTKQPHTPQVHPHTAACTCSAVNPCVCPVCVVPPLPSTGAFKVLVVVNGPRPDAVIQRHGGLPEQVRRALDAFGFDESIVEIDVHTTYELGATPLPEDAASKYVCAILGGSKFDVTDGAPWMLAMTDWLRRHIGQLPILGICFGHQILAHALGGRVGRNPNGWEQGTYTMKRAQSTSGNCDPLVNLLPPVLDVQLQHGQSVTRLPAGAVSFYTTPCESNQFVRFAPQTYGVQFHPEFDNLTMDTYLRVCGMKGVSTSAMSKEPQPTPIATSIIPKFVELALAWAASRAF